uniref:Zinc finger protein 26 n=1 Tax=Cacopsylla melanoneura TaxID=428564 RepID=A0A8D8T5W6_9HEMI
MENLNIIQCQSVMDSVFIVSFRVTKENERRVKEKAIVCEYDLSLIRSVDQSSKLLGALDMDDMKCKSCGLVEESETALYVHTWECAKQNKIFKCSLCAKRFNLKNTLKKHLRNKHLKKRISCHICNQDFKTEYTRKKHKEICLEQNKNENSCYKNPYKCNLCGQIERSKNDFLNHMRHCEGQFYDCDLCQERFTKKHAIREHMFSHTNERPYSCDFCQKTFLLKRRLHLHIRRVHILKLANNSKKIFSCITCQKQYRCKQSLRTHVLSHLDAVTPYICQLCGKQYSSRGNMNRHIAVWHEQKNTEKNKQRVQCEVCGKSYSQPRHLHRHFSITHGDGKLKCPICGKRLSEKKGYDIHMNTHSGVKPWCCEVCGRGFSTKDYLKVHARIHTGDSPHRCHFCPKTYKQKSALTAHYRLHHPGVGDPQN